MLLIRVYLEESRQGASLQGKRMKQLFLSFPLGLGLRLGDCGGEGLTTWLV